MALVTLNDIKVLRPVVSNLPTDRLSPFIEEAEQMDVKPVFAHCEGDFFYYITQNTGNAAIAKLLSGGTYTYQGNTYSFKGLKAAIALYAYARLVNNNDITVTSNNVVAKQFDYGQQQERGRVKEVVADARNVAAQYMEEVKEFLCRNESDYPLYKGMTKSTRKGIRFLSVKGKE